MKITKKVVTVQELINGYVDYTDEDIEKGVFAYGGKLCVRPPFQRSFVYNLTQENEVINTVLRGFPLNIMYWVDNEDGTYNCLDGQQRTISLCHFAHNITTFIANWLPNPKQHYTYMTLNHINPDLIQKFLNYELEVYICKGTKSEQMEWFRVINIAGERLFDQELRNTAYTGKWLTEAKRYFSRADPSSTAATPAERIGSNFTNKNANRQELLEQVIIWKIGDDSDAAICEYMQAHQFDDNADDLINYWKNVINWVNSLFVLSKFDSGMKTVNWGILYNQHKDDDLDPNEVTEKYNELMGFKASKELDVSVAKICEYCITRNEKLLKHRAFSEAQRLTMYRRQNGVCPDCKEHFNINNMDAHHIIPWYNNGVTELANGVMLCKPCHTKRHAMTT